MGRIAFGQPRIRSYAANAATSMADRRVDRTNKKPVTSEQSHFAQRVRRFKQSAHRSSVGILLFKRYNKRMDFTTRYAHLNAAQKQAVDTIDGPVMVIAGPGTGKTELLSMRTANILQKTDTLPENILCLTFTESGAEAMRKRLTTIIGPAAYKVAIHTFHSFGTEIINQNGEYFYHGAHFRAADELSSYELLQSIFDELDYNNPLASKMNGEYTHLHDTLTTISELKKSGLTSDELLQILDANDNVIEAIEPKIAAIFTDRISKTTASALAKLIDPLQKQIKPLPIPGITPLGQVLADGLEAAVKEAEASNSTKPITAWRSSWLKKDEQGVFVLKSRDRQTKLRAVSYVYYQYLARMQEASLYDFDDMILRVVHAMEVFNDLRFNLQEKYQYIMVDEFQDTNLAQMRILFNLTNNETNNGKPNILVVGDDDQAIYSFQGADVGNIHAFRTIFQATTLITLTDNYRSAETVLKHAQNIITLGNNRLENYIPEVDKTLTAHHSSKNASVQLLELASASSERAWLAATIARSIKEGTKPSDIAVLARRHHEIVALLPYFAQAGVKVNYERRDNVLDLEILTIIVHISRILVALYEGRHQDADSLLPELLAHPAFAITPQSLWKLSLQASENHQTWMEVMSNTPAFLALHTWLITTSAALAHTPLEYMLDHIIGKGDSIGSAFISPLYMYFFSEKARKSDPTIYITYLEALRTIRTKLREYQPDETPTLQSFLEFIRLHKRLGSTITNSFSRSGNTDDAISLMTAHKSKGLEFDTVYITGAIDTSWGERVRTRSRLIGYPENLPLSPAGDTLDERLRLFFVAMTRAKNHLFISYALADDAAKATAPASFLLSDMWQPKNTVSSDTLALQRQEAELAWYQPVIQPMSASMAELLKPQLERYKLSATHLNAFLDISRGGPQAFLINHLLRFPQASAPSAAYGSAIHATLQRVHSHLSATGKQRPIEDVLHDFEENLRSRHLPEKDLSHYLQKGSDVLLTYLEAKYDHFHARQKAELSFAGQSVFLDEVHLTGSLDLVDFSDNVITVTDYKTGKAARSWTGKTDFEKIKLHRYKQQLMFYYLLVHHSRDYHNYSVEKAALEFVEPTPSGEIITLEARFSQEDLEQFKLLIRVVWKHIVTLQLPDTSTYEPTYKGMLAFEQDLLK